jgi:hypothetical protein
VKRGLAPEQNCKRPFELTRLLQRSTTLPSYLQKMITEAQRKAIDDVVQTITSYTAGRRVLSVMFQELPDREAWKEYYSVIPEPRSLAGIKVGYGV